LKKFQLRFYRFLKTRNSGNNADVQRYFKLAYQNGGGRDSRTGGLDFLAGQKIIGAGDNDD
jgi:hypothetical protein